MSDFWSEREILVSITTLFGDWKNKVKEINSLGLKRVALFLTGLEFRNINKKEIFSEIEKSGIEEIPFVHIINKTTPEDLKYLIKRFNTKAFNIHSEDKYPLKYDLSKYKNMIYIENIFRYPPKESELKNFAGTCIDISHLEIARNRYPKVYEKTIPVINKFVCGCNHVASYKEKSIEDVRYIKKYPERSSHYYTNLPQFDYLLKYPSKYFSRLIALELENPIPDQLKAKEYIYNLLKNKTK